MDGRLVGSLIKVQSQDSGFPNQFAQPPKSVAVDSTSCGWFNAVPAPHVLCLSPQPATLPRPLAILPRPLATHQRPPATHQQVRNLAAACKAMVFSG